MVWHTKRHGGSRPNIKPSYTCGRSDTARARRDIMTFNFDLLKTADLLGFRHVLPTIFTVLRLQPPVPSPPHRDSWVQYGLRWEGAIICDALSGNKETRWNTGLKDAVNANVVENSHVSIRPRHRAFAHCLPDCTGLTFSKRCQSHVIDAHVFVWTVNVGGDETCRCVTIALNAQLLISARLMTSRSHCLSAIQTCRQAHAIIRLLRNRLPSSIWCSDLSIGTWQFRNGK